MYNRHMVGMKQEMRQSQQLVMTQQLQQSIKLLQLSSAELQEFIDTEIEKNPLLSREEGDDAPAEGAENETPASDEISDSGEQNSGEQKELTVSDNDYSVGESLDDESYSNDWEGDEIRISASEHSGGGGFSDAGEGPDIEGAAASDKTLREHVLEQIRMDMTDPIDILIAEKLADMLDDSGYLREDTSPLAEQLGVSAEDIEHVIARLQQFEPVGVFARSLTECLRLQLADMNRLDPMMEVLLDNLEMIGRGELQGLRKKCGVEDEDFADMMADIRRCNPKPGMGYAREDVQPVVPDVIVRRTRGAKGQGWHIELNPEALPKVLVNRQYSTELGARAADKEAKKFMGEQLANANWLIKALDSRAQTILKVTEAIVKSQEKFMLHGIRYLKPLVLKDIAAEVGMHESTISRVTTAKYMATPRGTLELKFFFNSSISSGSGQTDFSSKTVQFYIKDLVEKETVEQVLSDDAIVTLLKDKNIDVARRTVTKYREEMNIPSSVIRRRMKRGA
jgi:RNA polymerase sigma-54 factor